MVSMIVWLALQAEVVLEARSHGREIVLTGKFRGATEPAAAVVRFRRIVRRAEWSTGEVAEVALDRPWERRVAVEKGMFVCRERFDGPGRVEVEAAIAPDGAPSRGAFRVGTSADAAAEFRREVKRTAALLDEARALLEAESPRPLRLEKAREAAMEAASTGALSATGDQLSLFLSDVERLAGPSGAARPLSSVTGGPLTRSVATETLGWIRSLAATERRRVIVDELRELAGEIRSRVAAGDSKAWNRASAGIDRALGGWIAAALEEGTDEVKERAAVVERLFQLAPGMVDNLPSVRSEWDELEKRQDDQDVSSLR